MSYLLHPAPWQGASLEALGMNIFYLDEHIETCAQYHCDAHVIKMILESAQILCTVLWKQGVSAPYRATHANHPSVLWAGESYANWVWLNTLTAALNEEYRYRFDAQVNHKSYEVVLTLSTPLLIDRGLTEIPQVMPVEYQHPDPVIAYRNYFIGCKSSLARWKKRGAPAWYPGEKIS